MRQKFMLVVVSITAAMVVSLTGCASLVVAGTVTGKYQSDAGETAQYSVCYGYGVGMRPDGTFGMGWSHGRHKTCPMGPVVVPAVWGVIVTDGDREVRWDVSQEVWDEVELGDWFDGSARL